MTAEEQLSGIRAMADGVCARCPEPVLKDQRIVRAPGASEGWIHVTCAPGWDDSEAGPTRKPRKKAAKKTAAGGQTPDSGVVGSESEVGAVPPAAPVDHARTRAEEDEWWEQTTPGIVAGMPNDVYHRDPWVGGSVSNSDAKLLLDAPALYRYAKDHPRTGSSKQMNLGSAAHTKVLGEGDPLVKIDAAEYRTNAAKQARDEAHAAGKIPLLGVRKYDDRLCEWETVDEMAKVLERDPLAPQLFARGRAEVSAFWTDTDTGVARRCRFDWLPDVVPGQRLIVPDFKSTERSVSPGAFARSADDFGYDMQDYTYTSALAALGVDVDAAFVFVVQSVTPPYLVAVHQLDDDARELGRQRTLRALRRWLYATETGDWFAYAGEVHEVSLPGWASKTEEFEATSDARRYLRAGWEGWQR